MLLHHTLVRACLHWSFTRLERARDAARGKDLYDAMLLAEATTLPLPLLKAVFEIAESKPPPEDLISFGGDFEWVGFEEQNHATVEAWKQRLARALHPPLPEK